MDNNIFKEQSLFFQLPDLFHKDKKNILIYQIFFQLFWDLYLNRYLSLLSYKDK